MTLENKIRQILKDELKPENIRTIIHMTEFLKLKITRKYRKLVIYKDHVEVTFNMAFFNAQIIWETSSEVYYFLPK